MPIVESIMGIQIIGNNGENIIKSPIVEAYIGSSLQDSTKVASDSPTDISTKVEQLMAAKHSHANKAVLDKFAESDGKPTYDGKALGGGGGTSNLVVNLEVTGDDDGYTVTSASATFEQVDAAYKAGKDIAAEYVVSDVGVKVILPLFQAAEEVYVFGAYVNSQSVLAMVDASGWTISVNGTDAENVGYESESLPNVSNVKEALDSTASKAHTHDNKSVLDLLSAANGKLQYNGSDVGLKGDKGADGKDGSNGKDGTNGITPTIGTNGNWYLGTTDTGKPSRGEKGDKGTDGTNGKTPVKGTDYWTAADKAEIVADTLAALPTWTGGNY